MRPFPFFFQLLVQHPLQTIQLTHLHNFYLASRNSSRKAYDVGSLYKQIQESTRRKRQIQKRFSRIQVLKFYINPEIKCNSSRIRMTNQHELGTNIYYDSFRFFFKVFDQIIIRSLTFIKRLSYKRKGINIPAISVAPE